MAEVSAAQWAIIGGLSVVIVMLIYLVGKLGRYNTRQAKDVRDK